MSEDGAEEKDSQNVKRSPTSDDESCHSIKRARHSSADGEEVASLDIPSSVVNEAPRASSCPTVNPALRRWQSKQLAQSIVDNAINKVLGNSSPVHVTLDVLNPQIIENEGVAVAIRQQGLQRRRYIAAMSAAETWDRHKESAHSNENKMPGDDERLVRPEDLLNQAVSCAINRKGLASVSND